MFALLNRKRHSITTICHAPKSVKGFGKQVICSSIIQLGTNSFEFLCIKFMFSKKATKNDEIFSIDLRLCSECQIGGEDFVNFFGLLRKHEHYLGIYLQYFNFNPVFV